MGCSHSQQSIHPTTLKTSTEEEQTPLKLISYDNFQEVEKITDTIFQTYKKGNYDEAIQRYRQCIQLKPNHHQALYNIAICQQNKNKIDSAIQWYKKAILANAKYSYAYNNLANIWKYKNQDSKAIDLYKLAVAYNSTYTLAYTNMAVCYLKQQNYKQAFKCLSQAKKILPTDTNNLTQDNRVYIKDQLQKFNAQALNYKIGGVINPQWLKSMDDLVMQFQQQFGSNPAAVEEFTNALQASKIQKQYIIDAITRRKAA